MELLQHDLAISRYTPDQQSEWDAFVAASKNGTFLFKRAYMDYHADRFTDHSLVIKDKDGIVALLPANQKGDAIYSHQGLTYGGLIVPYDTKISHVLSLFTALAKHYKDAGASTLTYKQIPAVYFDFPAYEDEYALFRLGAQLTGRDTTFAVPAERKLGLGKNRSVNRSKKAGVVVKECDLYEQFWDEILIPNLARLETKPVHTIDEMRLLVSRFPQNIKLEGAFLDGRLLAATVLYIDRGVVHTQYIAANQEGKQLLALDFLFAELLTKHLPKERYFSFGTANRDKSLLNESLAEWKESFGARAFSNNIYSVTL